MALTTDLRDQILELPAGAPEELMEAIASLLVRGGVPLSRMSTALHVIHPEILGLHVSWKRGAGVSSVARGSQIFGNAVWLGTPVEAVVAHGKDEIRCRLDVPESEIPFKVLLDLRGEGAKDYFILGLDASRTLAAGSRDAFFRRVWISFSTDRDGGFSGSDLDLLRRLRPALAARLALVASQFSGRAIMRAYLGANAAERIESGAWLNAKRAPAPALGLGIAIHTGEVMYGNIGSRRRLDFTVIGAPVNEVCRVEPLTRTLGTDILLTEAFVRDAKLENARSFGKHALKGVGGELEVFGPSS